MKTPVASLSLGREHVPTFPTGRIPPAPNLHRGKVEEEEDEEAYFVLAPKKKITCGVRYSHVYIYVYELVGCVYVVENNLVFFFFIFFILCPS